MLESARDELLSAIDGLTPEQMVVSVLDDWSVKDLLAHVAVWEEQLLPDFRRVNEGHTPAFAAFRSEYIDRWNEMLMPLRRGFPLDQAIHEFHYCRSATLIALDQIPDELFTYGFVPTTCTISAQHDREHAAHIRQWREKEGI